LETDAKREGSDHLYGLLWFNEHNRNVEDHLIENRFIDVLVSTGANISEDILEAIGGTYWQGSPQVDDAELLKHRIDRFYDVYVDEMEYRRMENFISDFARGLKQNHAYSSREFLHLLGKHLSEMKIKCIVSTAYENNVPIFCPAICDSGYGIAMLLAKRQGHSVNMDRIKDVDESTRVAERVKQTGVIYIGGGVPKNFTQQVAVILTLEEGDHNLTPHKYAVQITTDSPQWGGLSGCTFEEAVSWGKISPNGRHVQCYCDATIALPILAHALDESVSNRRNHPDFTWLSNTK